MLLAALRKEWTKGTMYGCAFNPEIRPAFTVTSEETG